MLILLSINLDNEILLYVMIHIHYVQFIRSLTVSYYSLLFTKHYVKNLNKN